MNCYIIEDEKPAQDVLLNYINKTPNLNCLGVFESALELPIVLDMVDFIFLDIQLPEINGLDFLNNLEVKPKVIITTAYRNYAIEAFEVAVEDYLLKPFSYNRFLKSILRIRASIGTLPMKSDNNELFVYADKTFHKIFKNDILVIKAEVDYVYIILEKKKILVQNSLTNWNEKLNNEGFMQIHRSYIINLKKIDKIVGNVVYIMEHRIPVSKTYRAALFRLVKQNNFD